MSDNSPKLPAMAHPAVPSTAADRTSQPWWRFGIVWLVVGGPAAVVMASIFTAVLAWHGADQVLVETPSARILPVQPTSNTPAMTARNHAATAAASR